MILAQGGARAGYALYLKNGQLVFGVRENGKLYQAIAPDAPKAKFSLEAKLEKDGAMTLAIDGKIVARAQAAALIKTQPVDNLSIGQDIKGAVGNYNAPNSLDGTVENVQISAQ